MQRILTSLALGALLAVSCGLSARADLGVNCPTGQRFERRSQTCQLSLTTPGGAQRPAGSLKPSKADNGSRTVSACLINSAALGSSAVPCERDGGYWSNDQQCYVRTMKPQPAAGSPLWEGHTDGAVYECVRYSGSVVVAIRFWSRAMPAGPAAPVDPAVLARNIVTQMRLRAISIGMVPDDTPGSMGVVGLPVWMWAADRSEQTFGPLTRSASLGGVTVTAVARVDRIVWQMGDGEAVTCRTPGTPFRDGDGGRRSPDCGHVYTAQGTHTVRATSYWSVQWSASSGQTGVIPVQLEQSRIVVIGEIQVVRR